MKKVLYIILIFLITLAIFSCAEDEPFYSNPFTDTTAPVIEEVTFVTTPTNDSTPDYTFSSDEAGTITYGGSCSSTTTSAIDGNNTITFYSIHSSGIFLVSLNEGTYENCKITVTDTTGNVSNTLKITPFIVDLTAATLAEVTAVTTPTNDSTPDYTFSSSEAGTITYGGSCFSITTSATTNNNTITLISLNEGTYKKCKITVTDSAGNSVTLNIGLFVIDTTAPTVSSISPTDNQSSVSITDNITVTFSDAMDTTYVTTNTDNTSCYGNLGVSSDNFSSCVQMASAPASSNSNMTFTLDPYDNLTVSTTYKTRVTTGVKDTAGNTLSSQYETSTGFTTLSNWSSSTIARIGAVHDIDGDSLSPNSWMANYGTTPEIILQSTTDIILVAWRHQANTGDAEKIIVSKIVSANNGYSISGHVTVESLGLLAGFSVDNSSNFYVLSAKSENLSDNLSNIDHRSGIMTLQKFDSDTTRKYIVDVSLEGKYNTPIMSPMHAGTSRMVFGNGKLNVNFAGHTNISGGLRHQHSKQITFIADNGSVDSVYTGPSHSFDQRVVFDGTDFIGVGLSDAGPRGIAVAKVGTVTTLSKLEPLSESHCNLFSLTYPCGNGTTTSYRYNPVAYGIKGGNDGDTAMHYNMVFTRLGNIQVGTNGYPILFATEKSTGYTGSTVNLDARNLALVHVKNDFTSADYHDWDNSYKIGMVDNDTSLNSNFTSHAVTVVNKDNSSLTYSANNPGIVWFTNYSDKSLENVEKPKLVKISTNKFIAIWEKWKATNTSITGMSSDYVSTFAMLIDEYGNILEAAKDIGQVRLQRGDDVVELNGKAAWIRGDQETSSLILYTISESLGLTTYEL